MSAQAKENVPLQVKVYTRWVADQLAKGNADVQVHDISKDLSNGVALVELSKALTGKEPKREWAKTPEKPVDMIRNSDLSVQQFFEDGVHLIGIAGKDIHDNNVKIIRGYMWTLIERYTIGRAAYGDLDKDKTLGFADFIKLWALDRTSKYSNVKNFQPYPLAMCALLDSFAPDKVNFANLDPNDNKHNAQVAADVMKQLNVPVYIAPEDCDGDMDIKCVLTQLAAARIVLENLPVVPAVKIEESRIVSKLSDCVPVEEPEPEPEPEPTPAPAPVPVPPTPVETPAPLKEAKRHHYFGANNNYFASCNKFE